MDMENRVKCLADNYNCTKCKAKFEDETSLDKHIILHSFTEQCLTEAEMALRRKLLYQEVKRQQNELYCDKMSTSTALHKPRRIYRPKSKRIGLTKIKMEDCLRCDACSCIYIDAADYYKHMRNFHQKYNTVIPRSRKTSPIFLKNDKALTNLLFNEHSPVNTSPPTPDFIRQTIKSRWSEVVSQRLTSKFIKEESGEEVNEEEDMSLLLSNVEVNIKTEPPDF